MNERQQIKVDIDEHVMQRLQLWIKDSADLYKRIDEPRPGEEVLLILIKLMVRAMTVEVSKSSFLETMSIAYDICKQEQREQKTGRRV